MSKSLTKQIMLLDSMRFLRVYIRATASALVASQPIPQMVSVGYRMRPPCFKQLIMSINVIQVLYRAKIKLLRHLTIDSINIKSLVRFCIFVSNSGSD